MHRYILRPDLYGPSEDQVTSKSQVKSEVDEIDQLRAAEYGLLSLLLGKAPDAETLSRVATLKGDASDLGMAHIELAAARRRPMTAPSARNSSICSSGSAAANCCPMPPIT